jgi:UDP-N-acetylglucosamine 1-carboxyvinyltransferase
VIPDRIEMGTYAVAAAMAGGEVQLTRARPELIDSLLVKLEEAGCGVVRTEDGVIIKRNGHRLRPSTSRPSPIRASPPTCRPSSWP